jgi:GDPmannose 4,6-dehydratase
MKAFVTGVTGQDGHYLTDLLLDKGYDVYGLVRRTSQPKEIPDCIVIEGDVTDPSVIRVVEKIKPDEIYHLGALTHVGDSFKVPKSTIDVNTLGTLNLLEAAKSVGSKFYQASTSELFGISPSPQNEGTKFHPRSPYGISKLAAYWLTVNYRESYGLFTCNGILFNHESPLRGKDFVTQKIAEGVARIYHGLDEKIVLGNLDAKRDWGHAKDFVRGMWLMLQGRPDDFVLATGETHSIRDFLNLAFAHVGINHWEKLVEVNPKFIRPAEVPELCGDYSKAKTLLGWEPSYTFPQLVEEMVSAALRRYRGSAVQRKAQNYS